MDAKKFGVGLADGVIIGVIGTRTELPAIETPHGEKGVVIASIQGDPADFHKAGVEGGLGPVGRSVPRRRLKLPIRYSDREGADLVGGRSPSWCGSRHPD